MMFAYNYNHRWGKFAKENFANLVKLQKSRTLNLAKFSRYTVVQYPVCGTFAYIVTKIHHKTDPTQSICIKIVSRVPEDVVLYIE